MERFIACEAISDLVNAESEEKVKALIELLTRVWKRYYFSRKFLITLRAELESQLDFSADRLGHLKKKTLSKRLRKNNWLNRIMNLRKRRVVIT